MSSGDSQEPSPREGPRHAEESRLSSRYIVGLFVMAAVTLVLLMSYSIVLLMIGLTLQLVIGAEVALCALTVEVVRHVSRPGGPLPLRPWTTSPPSGGSDREAAH